MFKLFLRCAAICAALTGLLYLLVLVDVITVAVVKGVTYNVFMAVFGGISLVGVGVFFYVEGGASGGAGNFGTLLIALPALVMAGIGSVVSAALLVIKYIVLFMR